MARRKTLTDKQVKKLPTKEKRYTFPDPELRGHYVRVTPTGVKTYAAVARDPGGKQVWSTIETSDRIGIDAAREAARTRIQHIKAGLPAVEPLPPPVESFKVVAENWMELKVNADKLRTASEYQRVLDRYIYPELGGFEFESIRRRDVTRLLDKVQRQSGPRQADYVLATLRAIMNWEAARIDDYVPPIVKGMRRTKPKDTERKRILSDDELRLVWNAAGECGTYGAIVKFALLTAQRREKVMTLKRSDVSLDGEWTIPHKKNEKGSARSLVLPELALDVLRSQDVVEGNQYAFSGRGSGYYTGAHFGKIALDKKIFANLAEIKSEPLEPWVFHDLRRTARSLMSRAGVGPNVAERVLGHAIAGVEGVYDRHNYRDEKMAALERLAGLIERIVNPVENVTQIRKGA